MVRRLRYNVKGRPVPPPPQARRRFLRSAVLTIGVLAVPSAIDLIIVTRRAQLIGAILDAREPSHEAILGAGRDISTVDARPACQTSRLDDSCPEVVFHSRGFLGATYSFRVLYDDRGQQTRVERLGPWWLNQPFHAQ